MRLNNHGQLLMPFMTIFLLLALFLIHAIILSTETYWKIRMDIAARAAALSTVREQAAHLNTIATGQLAQNLTLQKAKLGIDVGLMQISLKSGFDATNGLMQLSFNNYYWQPSDVGRIICKANGAQTCVPDPFSTFIPQLTPQKVRVGFVHGYVPAGGKTYPNAYYTRDWATHTLKAQPDHWFGWMACRKRECSEQSAELWLDVKHTDLLHNGGFPRVIRNFWKMLKEGAGFQSFYPQFNARLRTKK